MSKIVFRKIFFRTERYRIEMQKVKMKNEIEELFFKPIIVSIDDMDRFDKN